MDELKLMTGFIKSLVAQAICHTIEKRLGVSPSLIFNDPITVYFDNNYATLHLNADVSLSRDDLSKLLSRLI